MDISLQQKFRKKIKINEKNREMLSMDAEILQFYVQKFAINCSDIL